MNRSQLTTEILDPRAIDDAWPSLAPMLAEALKEGYGEIEVEDLYRLLKEGAVTAFVVSEADIPQLVFVVEQAFTPRYSFVNVIAIAGRNLKASLVFLPALEHWALSMGAVEIRGWVHEQQYRLYRRLKMPFKKIYTIISHDLRGKLQ